MIWNANLLISHNYNDIVENLMGHVELCCLINENFVSNTPGGGLAQWGLINTLRQRQDGRHFPDDILKWIFFNEIIWISIEISLKFVPSGPINNIPASVQIMAWRWPGDKLLSEPMMISLLTHICITQPQWVNRTIGVEVVILKAWSLNTLWIKIPITCEITLEMNATFVHVRAWYHWLQAISHYLSQCWPRSMSPYGANLSLLIEFQPCKCSSTTWRILHFYTPLTTKLLGVYWFHCIRPSLRLSIRSTSRVRSVAPTVLVGSISYLYIIWCVTCRGSCKCSKFAFLAIF